jgi:hypothetical protein
MACEGLLGPLPSVAIFADTQCERQATYEWLGQLEEIGGHRIPIVTPTQGNLAEDALHSMRTTASRFLPLPAFVDEGGIGRMGRRQCTRSHKLDVIHREIREQLGLAKGERAAGRLYAEVWIGISGDESQRARPSRFELLGYRWPFLIDRPMRRRDCLMWLDQRGHPLPVKSSCVFCPFKVDVDWLELRDQDPDGWERAVAFDREINLEGHYLHRSLRPLDQVAFDPSVQLDLFGQECEGLCGV